MSRWILGVTGGIGSGKTAVTDHFQRLGIVVVDADLAARKVVEPGQPALAAIAAHFGDRVLDADGRLLRPVLREIVFSDPAQRKALEAITHPAIRETLERELTAADSPYAILASPLLWESGQSALVRRTLLVDAPEHLQIARASARDGVSPGQIEAILKTQWSREQRLARADDVLLNDGTLAALQAGVERLHAGYLREAST